MLLHILENCGGYKEGMTAMELAKARSGDSINHSKCYSILQHAAMTLDVTHAVLSEDVFNLKRLLRTETDWSLNKRLRVRNQPKGVPFKI